MVVREKEHMKLDVGKMVDHMTQGSCISTDSMKSDDDFSVLIIKLKLGHILIWIRLIWHTWLVNIMICQVGNIRVKRGRGEVWIIYA